MAQTLSSAVLSKSRLSRNRHYWAMCRIICRKSTGIPEVGFGYLEVVVSTAKAGGTGTEDGLRSLASYLNDEMDIYVNDGCYVNMTRHYSHNRVSSMSLSYESRVIGNTDPQVSQVEAGSDQACRTRTTRVGSASAAARTMSTSASSRRLRSSLSALAISLSTDSPLRARSSPEGRNSGAVHAKSFVRLATARAVTTSKLM